VKVSVKNLQNKVPVNSKKVVKTVQKVLSSEGIKKSGEITLCFVNDRKIKELNLKYLGKNNPTDVITFDMPEPKSSDEIFADIVISTDRAISNAKVFKTSPLYELYLYIVHGALHLLGYDDKTPKQKKIMHERACHILKIRNP
jgi:probable rRNA maturation factor